MAGALTEDRARPAAAPGPDLNDRAAKLTLLVGSLVTLAFLVGAMLRENYFTEWRYRQREYRRQTGRADHRSHVSSASFDERAYYCAMSARNA